MYLRTQQVFLHLRGALWSKSPNGATGGGCVACRWWEITVWHHWNVGIKDVKMPSPQLFVKHKFNSFMIICNNANLRRNYAQISKHTCSSTCIRNRTCHMSHFTSKPRSNSPVTPTFSQDMPAKVASEQSWLEDNIILPKVHTHLSLFHPIP